MAVRVSSAIYLYSTLSRLLLPWSQTAARKSGASDMATVQLRCSSASIWQNKWVVEETLHKCQRVIEMPCMLCMHAWLRAWCSAEHRLWPVLFGPSRPTNEARLCTYVRRPLANYYVPSTDNKYLRTYIRSAEHYVYSDTSKKV